MNRQRVELDVGWHTRGGAIVGTCVALTLATLGVGARFGTLPALVVLLSSALFALSRIQWAALDGPSLLIRDARSRYAYRAMSARLPARVAFRRAPVPWCRVALATRSQGPTLLLSGPDPTHPTLRAITMWIIVNGRRGTRIDPRLLDALAAMPEHGPARQPHDASHA